MKLLKIHNSLLTDGDKELKWEEYIHLIRAAERFDNGRLLLVIQTICVTGIQVSELKFISVKAVLCGKVEINNKGKCRTIFLLVCEKGVLLFDKIRYNEK